MVVLGVSGGRTDAAAALAIDGRIVAAACESSLIGRAAAGYHAGGPPPTATAACLRRAGLKASDITQIVVVEGDTHDGHADRLVESAQPWAGRDPSTHDGSASLRGLDAARHEYAAILVGLLDRPVARIGATFAAAVHAALSAADDQPAVVVLDARRDSVGATSSVLNSLSTEPTGGIGGAVGASGATGGGGAVYGWRDGRLQRVRAVDGFSELIASAGLFGEALGLGRRHDVDALALLGADEAPVWAEEFRRAWSIDERGGLACKTGWVEAAIAAAGQDIPGRLDAVTSPHRAVQERRRQLAASVSHVLASLVSELLARSRQETRARTIAAGGTLFGNARLNTRLRDALGDALTIARVPESAGLALGAALTPAFLDGRAARLDHVTLGPTFSESDIKDTLDNCRLDYVYEPDWQRLLTRVSALLARGRVVAWLQGAVDFGPRSAGSRSILCDPSNRYARDNINQYLLRRALDHPLPVAMTRETAAECLEQTLIAPFTLQFATVRESCADKLKGVLDSARGCPVHGVDRAHAAELCDLLDLHRQRTQVPGLIHITLASEGEPLAGTPRAAIRAMFSSAIDVLVMGRFLLMKDYWLLRSES